MSKFKNIMFKNKMIMLICKGFYVDLIQFKQTKHISKIRNV